MQRGVLLWAIIVSSRNRTVERRGRQNARAWQTWRGLLLACFVANSLKIDVSFSSTKRSVQRNVKFGGSKAKAKLLSRLSHKVCRRLSSPVLLRKFTIIGHKGRTSVLLCRKCIKYPFLLYPYPVTDCLYLEENKAISVAILKSWT